jgi:hypothetical protein
MREPTPQTAPAQPRRSIFDTPRSPVMSIHSPISPARSIRGCESPASRSASSRAVLEEDEPQSPVRSIGTAGVTVSPKSSIRASSRGEVLPESRRGSIQASYSTKGSPRSLQERVAYSMRLTQAQVAVTIAQAKLTAWQTRRNELAMSLEDARFNLAQCKQEQIHS